MGQAAEATDQHAAAAALSLASVGLRAALVHAAVAAETADRESPQAPLLRRGVALRSPPRALIGTARSRERRACARLRPCVLGTLPSSAFASTCP
ncbi:hypothetical protein DD238_001791 [Peronospora effusa]|uniref:Uncharacterized protein n=1 Tax=Peronospora effusa TaxID=542832 RepID=A0A3M6VT26_9STRA|nr:hypothetical protein DD238_001791 [Peronospora effusa]RQM10912.1 hypothetical protein DD237_006078 [Peronospora effusa]